MNKKLMAVTTGAATLTLALAGCSSSSNDKVDAYAKSVCDQVQPQLKKIQDASNSIASVSSGDHKPEDVKNTDSTAFGQISGAYKALADAVNKAGAPPVNNGATLQQNAVKQLNDTAGSYDNLKKAVDGLNTSDQGKFADGLKSVVGQLTNVGRSGDDALNKLQSGDVGKAMAKQPGCQKPSPANPQSPSGAAGNPGASQPPSAQPSGGSSARPSASDSAKPSAKPSGSASPSPSKSS
ncbi:small secreted protein [Streptomyces sp. RPT161]|uniref:small secreted protein n=1 Tax=Streptomyces sp. RPT161 TaxID=3015993 RepID=UPI0022B8984D|nr:small secreted protein [Streptomyces sp. RPT161]